MRQAMMFSLFFVLAGAAVPLAAQAPAGQDTRWLPWIGCWEPTDETGSEGAALAVCFDLVGDGVEVTTIHDGETVGTERIVADGQPRPAADGGCEGTREAVWAADGRRAFVLSDLACAAGVDRSTSGVFALAGDGEFWVEIHGVRAAEREPVLSVRSFQPASRATLERNRVSAPEAGRELAVRTSRTAAAAALDFDDVAEAVDVVGPEVTAALVAEMGHAFPLDARALRTLRDMGVPSEVMDMMVAVTWPEQFRIEGGEAAIQTPDRTAYTDQRRPMAGYAGYRSAWRCSPWDRFCWDPLYYDYYRYGYYGSGFGGGFGGGWYTGPRYIVVGPGTIRERAGRVTPGGYSSGGSTGRTARPSDARDSSPPAADSRTPRPVRETAPRPTREAAPRPARERTPPPASSGGSRSSDPPPPTRRPVRRGGGGGGNGI